MSSQSAAWVTLIGTLGGVAVTVVGGVVIARSNDRSQHLRAEQLPSSETRREVWVARRDVYARYIVSAQHLFDRAFDYFLVNRNAPLDQGDFTLAPPADLVHAASEHESRRIDVLVLAAPNVVAELSKYAESRKRNWIEAGSGAGSTNKPACDADYAALVSAFQADVSKYAGPA